MGQSGSSESVDAYAARLKSPQKEIVDGLRRLVRELAPGLRETINPWGNPVWTGQADVFWLIAYAHHVDFGFCRGTELQDPSGLLEGTGKHFRHVKLREPKHVGRADLAKLIERAIELDRTGRGRGPRPGGRPRRGG